MSRCAWPCCGRCSDREVPLSERAARPRRPRRRRDRRARRRRARRRRRDRRGRRRRSRRRRARPVLDAEGCVVAPGLVDIQVHFREPGREDSETIETGARAAALGGCTAVVCMPNTEPPLDDAAVVQSVLERGRRVGLCDVRVAGCITKGRRGEELAPMGELYDLGVRVFTDDGDCVADAPRDAARVRVRSARCRARCSRSTPRIPRSCAAGTCTKARGRRGSASRAGPPRRSRRSWRATSQLAQAHRRPLPRAAPVERGVGRARARGQGRRRARHRRVHAAAPRAHRRGVRATSTRCSR